MFRLALMAVAVVVFAFGSPAKADEFFLAADGVSVEKRVSGLEKRVADLEKKLAVANKVEARGPVNPITPTKIKFQVCVNGVCHLGECDNLNQVPIGATIMNATALAAGTPCPMGPCGDNCSCASPMSVGTSASSGRTGWYLGKNLGRGKRASVGSGCASCGQ